MPNKKHKKNVSLILSNNINLFIYLYNNILSFKNLIYIILIVNIFIKLKIMRYYVFR